MDYRQKINSAAMPMLRYGLGFVFLWFGFSQIQNPDQWVSYLPDWAQSLSMLPQQFVTINGLFEIIAGVMLMLGIYTNLVALLLSLHLFGITFSIGLNNIGIRDFGLAVATLAIAMLPNKEFSLDEVLNSNKTI